MDSDSNKRVARNGKVYDSFDHWTLVIFQVKGCDIIPLLSGFNFYYKHCSFITPSSDDVIEEVTVILEFFRNNEESYLRSQFTNACVAGGLQTPDHKWVRTNKEKGYLRSAFGNRSVFTILHANPVDNVSVRKSKKDQEVISAFGGSLESLSKEVCNSVIGVDSIGIDYRATHDEFKKKYVLHDHASIGDFISMFKFFKSMK